MLFSWAWVSGTHGAHQSVLLPVRDTSTNCPAALQNDKGASFHHAIYIGAGWRGARAAETVEAHVWCEVDRRMGMCPGGEQEGDDPAAMLQAVGAQEAAAHRLVVNPNTPPSSPHGCPLCPANLCKVHPCCLSGGRSRNPAPTPGDWQLIL